MKFTSGSFLKNSIYGAWCLLRFCLEINPQMSIFVCCLPNCLARKCCTKKLIKNQISGYLPCEKVTPGLKYLHHQGIPTQKKYVDCSAKRHFLNNKNLTIILEIWFKYSSVNSQSITLGLLGSWATNSCFAYTF